MISAYMCVMIAHEYRLRWIGLQSNEIITILANNIISIADS